MRKAPAVRRALFAHANYIGGTTPSFSTTTRCATNYVPFTGRRDDEHLLARRQVGARGRRKGHDSVRSRGTVTELLPPLYDSFRSRPLVPCTTLSTFAFVIELFGPRSHA